MDQPVKLLGAGYWIGHGVLPVDDDWSRRNGRPDRRCNKVCGGFQSVSGVIEPGHIGRPRQNNIGFRKNDGQLRCEGKTEHRAIARTASKQCSPIKGVAR